MRIVTTLGIAVCALCAFGCALRPSFQTEHVDAVVVSVSEYASTPAYISQKATIPVATGGAVINVPVGGNALFGESYLVELRLNSGKLIKTNSQRAFRVGDCVTLWHAGGVNEAQGEYNFVSGTLERAVSCK
jgi:hypothetical protein